MKFIFATAMLFASFAQGEDNRCLKVCGKFELTIYSSAFVNSDPKYTIDISCKTLDTQDYWESFQPISGDPFYRGIMFFPYFNDSCLADIEYHDGGNNIYRVKALTLDGSFVLQLSSPYPSNEILLFKRLK